MAKVGGVVRRGENYGVVIGVKAADFDAIQVEWADGTTEWVTVRDVEWIDSRE